jgi:hypothetical protein
MSRLRQASIPEKSEIAFESDFGVVFNRKKRSGALSGNQIRPILSADDSKFQQIRRKSSFTSRRSSTVVDIKNIQIPFDKDKVFGEMKRDSKDDYEIVRFSKMRVWNSTSTLFVQSTMNKPDILRCIRW